MTKNNDSAAAVEGDDEPFEKEMARLTAELGARWIRQPGWTR